MRVTTLVALAAALVACAAPRATPARTPEAARAGAYTLDLVDEAGAPLPTFEHRGRTYVLGTLGQRYLVRVRNRSGRRVEVVVSVDGRDVLDGRPAALGKRGYVVDAYGEVVIDGFRLDEASVAAFRFASVPRSYAARMGDARDVGVVGVAVFPERPLPPLRRPPLPVPYGAPRDEGPAPEARGEAAPEALGERADAERSSRAPSGAMARPEPRRGLGTEFGEEHESQVTRVSFERASRSPAAVLTLRYDDRPGLLALGIDVDGWRSARREAWLRETAEPFRQDASFARPPPGWRR